MRRQVLADLLFPAKCVGCRRLISPFEGKGEVFCPSCLERWRAACAPRRDSGDGTPDGADLTVSLATYRAGKTTGAAERFVYHVKHVGSRRAIDYAAALLAEQLGARDTPVVTYPPRRRAAVKRDGFDQASRMARCLAGRVGGKREALFYRARKGWREQKRLDGEARRQNADAAFLPRRDLEARVKGRTVILVDDLITTGATLRACTAYLREAGAKSVIWATIARTTEK